VIQSWLRVFNDDPSRAVADLMSGRAGIGASLRLDVPELLRSLFADGASMASERRRLDQALYVWLENMRANYANETSRIGFSVYSKRLVDAFETLQLLDLSDTRERIRDNVHTWIQWLSPLRVAPGRDPALECWRLLTAGQSETPSLIATWLRLAADPRSEYLDVAVMGLERAPTKDAKINRILLLRALLVHAVAMRCPADQAHAFFKKRFAALRGRATVAFPRAPKTWDNELGSAMAVVQEHNPSQRLLEIVGLIEQDRQAPRSRTRGRVPRKSPPIQPVEQLFSEINGKSAPPDKLADRLFELLRERLRHAEETGDSYFFIRTLCRLGDALLKRGGLGAKALTDFGTMIENGLAWAPTNEFCWTLYADWFGAKGNNEAREWVLREIARFSPEHQVSRVELARLLKERGEQHWDEAERWLREAAERNPSHEHARVESARL
jgi:hypothetical protein